MIVKKYKVKQCSKIWKLSRRKSHLTASTISKLFRKLYYKKDINRNVSYKERIKFINNIKNINIKSHDREIEYVNHNIKKMFDKGKVGESEIKKRLFDNEMDSNYKIIYQPYYEIYLIIQNKYNLRISVSPDIIFGFIYEFYEKHIPIEIKTRTVGNEIWKKPSIESIYQLMVQCFSINSYEGIILRVNFINNNHNNSIEPLQIFKIKFHKDIKYLFKKQITNFINNPESEMLDIFENGIFYDIVDKKEIKVNPKSKITYKFIYDFYNMLLFK